MVGFNEDEGLMISEFFLQVRSTFAIKMDFAVMSQAPHLYDVVRQLWPVLGPYSLLGVILILHQSTRSKAKTDDVQVHSSEATTDIVNLATDLVTAYTGGFDCDFLSRGVLVLHNCGGNSDGDYGGKDEDG